MDLKTNNQADSEDNGEIEDMPRGIERYGRRGERIQVSTLSAGVNEYGCCKGILRPGLRGTF